MMGCHVVELKAGGVSWVGTPCHHWGKAAGSKGGVWQQQKRKAFLKRKGERGKREEEKNGGKERRKGGKKKDKTGSGYKVNPLITVIAKKAERSEENGVFRGGYPEERSAQSGSREQPFGGRVGGKRGFPGWLP